ncbi:hypothetical protein BH20ACT17_BH20ACT17_17200 [soil metagenome]
MYAGDDLRAWATSVPDLKRLLFATLALSWPLYGVAHLFGAQHLTSFTLLGAALTFAGASSGRAVARTLAHRSERLQERTAIVGSGLVAELLGVPLTVAVPVTVARVPEVETCEIADDLIATPACLSWYVSWPFGADTPTR